MQSITSATEHSGLTVPTVTTVMNRLVEAGIVRALTGKQRGRVFGYDRYLKLLNEGTTTPPSR